MLNPLSSIENTQAVDIHPNTKVFIAFITISVVYNIDVQLQRYKIFLIFARKNKKVCPRNKFCSRDFICDLHFALLKTTDKDN